ncbi:MAG: PQQ-like beta-propeller repeat protein [Pedosphaera parvula]|nr:PQQ-like beta-propeller repeat protein [Pedosphaera parvula]
MLGYTTFAADWPQSRGPHRDGQPADPKHTLVALPKEPKVLWRLATGPGHAAPVIAGNRLFYLDQLEGKEVVHAVEVATGKELWRQPYDSNPAEYSGFGQGPRCAPLVEGDRVYLQSGRGEFRCLSVTDGKTRWRFNFEKDFGATWFGNKSSNPDAKETATRRHGNTGSPVIDGDRIFVPVGDPNGATLVCFSKLTGQKLWQAGQDNAAYSSLMAGTLGGVRQAVHFTADALMGVDTANGKLLWRIPVKTGAKRHTVTPIVVGDSVCVSSHSVGMIKTKIVKDGGSIKAEQEWANPAVKTMLSTPVLVGDYLYGLGTTKKNNADFVCVDFKTGREVWNQPGAFADYASLIALGDKILALNSTGELSLLKANPQHFEELGRLQVCGKTWSFPAYADGKLYVRDERQIMALELVK